MDRSEAKWRAQQLVARMTVSEKMTQLRYDSPAIERLGVPAYNWWNEALHGVARAGTATSFPQAIGMGATFDEALMKRVGDVIATEGRAKYNAYAAMGDRDIYKGLTFWSPNVNIFRDPRWGRGQETYGEDPYLTGTLGCAFVRGLQGDGEYMKAAACAKHFAVHWLQRRTWRRPTFRHSEGLWRRLVWRRSWAATTALTGNLPAGAGPFLKRFFGGPGSFRDMSCQTAGRSAISMSIIMSQTTQSTVQPWRSTMAAI